MSATRQPLKIVLTLGALLWASASFSNPLLPSQEEPNFFNVRICRDRQVLSALKTAAAIPRLNEDPRSCWLTPGARWIRVWLMIRPGFLSAAERGALIAVARDGLVEHRVARRANAIVLLNDGWNCEEVGSALLLDDDTVREWFEVYQRQGMAGVGEI